MGHWAVLLILGLHVCLLSHLQAQLQDGSHGDPNDVDDCQKATPVCGANATCSSDDDGDTTKCKCMDGFASDFVIFEPNQKHCQDINECRETVFTHDNGTITLRASATNNCSHNSVCHNTIGSFECKCKPGYKAISGKKCDDINECKNPDICGEGGTCENLEGSYCCDCSQGYSNYGNRETQCTELKCDKFSTEQTAEQTLPGLADILSLMRNNCLTLSNPGPSGGTLPGEVLLENLFTATDGLLSPGRLGNSEEVSRLLGTVEDATRLVGLQLKHNQTSMETSHTEVELVIMRGSTPPKGPIRLANEHASLDTSWETAAGNGTYPGFALAGLVSYKDLEMSVNNSFESLTDLEAEADPDASRQVTYQINSKVVTALVSNPETDRLHQPVLLTFTHLQERAESEDLNYVCVFWEERSDGGAWSQRGCARRTANASHTACACTHLSSFAVLMALYDYEDTFELRVFTWLFLSVSLVCLLLCILTFHLCRSIHSTRTTIHLHLAICLFLADLVFLAGIQATGTKGGCALVAGLLHFFFLGAFCWMLLEGVQLYHMVVLVFNTNIRHLYLHAVGYGLPLAIVIISAISYPGGYGTKRHCWLSLKHDFIWSFFGPACAIIILNIFFFIVTVWKLAEKFSALNPDLTNLRRIKAFTVTAVAQLCVLGIMWVFGAFQFQAEGTRAFTYLFTILNSLQGAMLFLMHCLLSKAVREEYAKFLSCICRPQKKKYTDFSQSTTNPSSQLQGRSGQNTGESQI